MNRLFNLAVDPSDLGMQLIKAETQADMQEVIGAGTGTGAVVSVNGKTGTVVLVPEDIGAAPLVDGKVPNEVLPPLAITETFTVNSEVAQLALNAQEGDVCIRTDLGETYIHLNSYTGTMLDWTPLLSPTAGVTSVNGKTGAVSLTATDLSAVSTTGDQNIAGVKTFTAAQTRFSSNAPGFWLNEADGQFGMFVVLDADILQFQVRPTGFVNSIVDMPFRIEMGNKVITTDYLVRPRTTNKDDIGSATFRYRNIYATQLDISGTAAQKESSRRSLGLPITVSATAPTSPVEGDVWIDIS